MDQSKRSRGRPPKKEGTKANVRLTFSLYPDEARMIEEWAKRHDVGLVDALRHILKVASSKERTTA